MFLNSKKIILVLEDIIELEKTQAIINQTLQEQINLTNTRVKLLETELENVKKALKEKSSST